MCKLTRPDDTCFGDVFDGFVATRRDAGQHITKRKRPPILNSDSEEDGEDGDVSDEDGGDVEEGEEDEEEDEEREERAMGLGAEDEMGSEGGDRNAETETHSDSGPEYSTEIDSDVQRSPAHSSHIPLLIKKCLFSHSFTFSWLQQHFHLIQYLILLLYVPYSIHIKLNIHVTYTCSMLALDISSSATCSRTRSLLLSYTKYCSGRSTETFGGGK